MKNLKNTWNFIPHTHSFNELHIVLDGKCKMDLENNNICLSEDDYILVPANTEHCFRECSNDFFRFSIAFYIIYEKNQSLIPKSSVLHLNDKSNSYLKNILTEYKENKLGCKNITDALFSCLLIEILRSSDIFQLIEAKPCINSDFYSALQFIDNSISHKITAEAVANKVFLSLRQLNRIFSANLNMTVTQYIKAKKLNNVKEYLKKTGLNIKEIAFLNGFDNETAFCKFFKRETGMSPTEYRLSEKT